MVGATSEFSQKQVCCAIERQNTFEEGKLGSSWDLGIWMGQSTRTNEHLVGTRTGVIRARTVKRRPETLKWDRELYEAMNLCLG